VGHAVVHGIDKAGHVVEKVIKPVASFVHGAADEVQKGAALVGRFAPMLGPEGMEAAKLANTIGGAAKTVSNVSGGIENMSKADVAKHVTNLAKQHVLAGGIMYDPRVNTIKQLVEHLNLSGQPMTIEFFGKSGRLVGTMIVGGKACGLWPGSDEVKATILQPTSKGGALGINKEILRNPWREEGQQVEKAEGIQSWREDLKRMMENTAGRVRPQVGAFSTLVKAAPLQHWLPPRSMDMQVNEESEKQMSDTDDDQMTYMPELPSAQPSEYANSEY